MLKVLIAEDEEPIAHMYEIKLKASGFEVKVAFNGEQGLEIAESWKPDLILLDLRMPVMDGEEMLQKVRKANWGGRTRVIILTNISKDEAPLSLRLLNVDRYIVKAHHTPSQILEIINDVLRENVNVK